MSAKYPIKPPPFIVQQGRFRLLVNAPHDKVGISLDIDGHGLTMLLDRRQALDLRRALFECVYSEAEPSQNK